MKSVRSRLTIALAAHLLIVASIASGATFSISPNTISNQYTGFITLQAGGLTNGEDVLVEKFIDLNANGVIDAGDVLVQSFHLKDGQASIINGVMNFNVPGDLNPAASNITAQLSFAAIEPDHLVGGYAFKLSSPTGRFAPLTNLFTVTNSAYTQSITGTVRSSGSNIPYASVVLLAAAPGEDNFFIGGAVADSSGNFTIKAAPGAYQLLAIRSNYVADASLNPTVTLASGVIITTNVIVAPASRTISGRVVDAANTSLALPGMLVLAQTKDRTQTVLGWSDSAGNFALPVSANQWRLKADNQAPLHGYVTPQQSSANTLSGNVAGYTLALAQATALFYGSVKDDQNHPMTGVNISCEDQSAPFDSQAWTDANGNYVVGVIGGDWCFSINSGSATTVGYNYSQAPCSTNITDGQAIRVDFLAVRATNHITGYVRDQRNAPVSGLNVFANGTVNGADFSANNVNTDASGFYSLTVAHGDWQVGLDCDSDQGLAARGYECVDNQDVDTSTGDAVANFTPLNFRPQLSSPRKPSASQFQFRINGLAGSNYVILVSSNLTTWSPLYTTNAPADSFLFTDPSATNNRRFYRTLLGP